MTENLLLRAEEVSKHLGISLSQTYALLAAGSLPCLRIGRSVRVPSASLEAWIAAHTTYPEEEGRWAN